MRSALLLTALLAALAFAQDNPNRLYQLRELQKATISYTGGRKLATWLMDTSAKRQEGMMFLNPQDLTLDQSMLFIFPDAAPRAFWNNNVKFDLDIAYIDAQGKVFTIKVLHKMSTASVTSDGSAKYVLEMKRGGFKKHGIAKGTVFKLSGLAARG